MVLKLHLCMYYLKIKELLPLCYGSKIAFVNIYYLKIKELLLLLYSKIRFVNILS